MPVAARFFILLTALVLCWPGGAARAQALSQGIQTENAFSQLVSEKSGIAPGETVLIGFHQRLREGWHVYWSNPGDSGLPLTLNWILPEGFEAGDIQYPVPHNLPLGPLVNYGHEGEPAFLVGITAPEDAEPGMMAEFTVSATWLICDDICIPEDGVLSLTLPVVASPAGPDPMGEPIIAEAKEHLPQPAGFSAMSFDYERRPVLRLLTDQFADGRDVVFFPYTPGLIEPAGAQEMAAGDGYLDIFLKAGFEYTPDDFGNLDGVIAVGKGRDYRGLVIAAPSGPAPDNARPALVASPSGTGANAPGPGFLAILGLAFLGGIILNIMPCVFPVIFLKAAGIARVAHEDTGTVRAHGLLYTAGILLAFLAIAGLLIFLRAGGEQIGWGFHLQSPVTVAVFAVVIFLVGLNLAGLFEVGTSVQGIGNDLASKGGNTGAFFTGLLAVAVAAPCIGPFLGVPVGYALSEPPLAGLAVFAVMGLGLALPYLLISFVPALARLLPKPGPWMETFKQVLSFAMFATLIWLIWTLTLQAGTDGLVELLIALLLAGFAAWAFGRTQKAPGAGWAGRISALVALIAAIFMVSGIEPQARTVTATGAPGEGDLTELPTAIYSEAALESYRDAGTPVFVDFTAAWCVTCQVNKQTVLKRPQVVEAFHEKGVIYMVADWTVQDPDITKALEAQGRSGVPLYLFYPPGAGEPLVLPQVLSIDLMLKTFSAL